MEDRILVSVGMEYSQKTMEVCDDVLQALLVTLSGKSGTGQKHILEQFAEYVKAGGTIKAVRFDEEHLTDFHIESQKTWTNVLCGSGCTGETGRYFDSGL